MLGTANHKRPFTVKKIRPQTPKRLTIAVMFHRLSVHLHTGGESRRPRRLMPATG